MMSPAAAIAIAQWHQSWGARRMCRRACRRGRFAALDAGPLMLHSGGARALRDSMCVCGALKGDWRDMAPRLLHRVALQFAGVAQAAPERGTRVGGDHE
jgi:hypothetical protein